MNINPDVAYKELHAQNEFLKNRNLALAQMLFETSAERDQLRAELDASRKVMEADHGAAE